MSQDAIRHRNAVVGAGGHHMKLAAQHVVDPEKKLVIVKFGKTLTVEDIGRYAVLLQANPTFQPGFSEIADLTEVEEVGLQADDFMRLADQVDPFSPDAKRAFVARSALQKHAARICVLRGISKSSPRSRRRSGGLERNFPYSLALGRS